MAGQILRCSTKKDKNVWRIRWDGPRDQFGKRKRLHETVRGTKKEAQAILDKRILMVEGGSYVDRSNASVAQLMETFLNKYCVLPTVCIRTKQGYQHYINRHVNPSIGHVSYQKLTPQQIRDIYAGMLERGLSHTTVLH